ncbi:MAG: hypothetical protein K1X83_02615 [Oligoflexia bacterium]|nr:hypothetical protein [Oligoflexia bacterium]
MLTTHATPRISAADTVAIRIRLLPAHVAGDENTLRRACKEVAAVYGGNALQISAISSWLKIFSKRLLREKGIEQLVGYREILSLALLRRSLPEEDAQTQASAREIAGKAGLSASMMLDLAERLNATIDTPPLAKAAVKRANPISQLKLPSPEQFQKMALEFFVERLDGLLTPHENAGKLSLSVSPELRQPLNDYLGFAATQLQPATTDWLLAIALSGGGDLRHIRNCVQDIEPPLSRNCEPHVQILSQIGLISIKAADGKPAVYEAEPYVQLAVVLRAIDEAGGFDTLPARTAGLFVGTFLSAMRRIRDKA